jgi:hypothetical protein
MQLGKRWCGLDADLVVEDLAQMTIGSKRVGLPSAPVEGEHLLSVQPFPQGVGRYQLIELADHQTVAAKSEQRVHPRFDGGEAQLVQARRDRSDGLELHNVGKDRSAPQV